MLRLLVTAAAVLGLIPPSITLAQSLPETAAYPFSGGMVETKEMKVVDDSTRPGPELCSGHDLDARDDGESRR